MSRTSRQRLLCVGHASIDLLFHIDALPAPPAKLAAREHHQSIGGMSANAATAAARLGADVAFAGPIGDDAPAAQIEAHFAAEGIAPLGLMRVPGTQSSLSSVLIDGHGERLIVAHRGEGLLRPPPFEARWLDGVDFVLVDPRCPIWSEAAMTLARAHGIPALLDADVAPRVVLQRLVPLAPWVVFSAPGLAAFSDAAPEDALAMVVAGGATHAAVTQGERGVLWCDTQRTLHRVPAHRVDPVVDTTGAGDVFHAALGVALAEGQPAEAALRFAAVAAAIKCGRAGGTRRTPTRAEVDAALRVSRAS